MWNLQSKFQEVVLEGHVSDVLSVAIASNNKFLVSVSQDKTVRIWDLQDKDQEAILKGHTDIVLSLAITSDKKFIVWKLKKSSRNRTHRSKNLHKNSRVKKKIIFSNFYSKLKNFSY